MRMALVAGGGVPPAVLPLLAGWADFVAAAAGVIVRLPAGVIGTMRLAERCGGGDADVAISEVAASRAAWADGGPSPSVAGVTAGVIERLPAGVIAMDLELPMTLAGCGGADVAIVEVAASRAAWVDGGCLSRDSWSRSASVGSAAADSAERASSAMLPRECVCARPAVAQQAHSIYMHTAHT